jgi:hypothetical protein
MNQLHATTKQQRTILTLIYRFRFVSTKHVQQALGIKYISNVQPRLDLLVKRNFIGRNYDGSLRLAGLPASYYLLPEGMDALKQFDRDVNKAVLHNIYKDKSAQDRFIRHCLMVADVSHELTRLYGDDVEFFTASEVKEYKYFPEPLPDAYVVVDDTARSEDDPLHFFVEVCEDSVMPFVHQKRVQEYIEFAEANEWQTETDTKLPHVLLICESDSLRRKLTRVTDKALENSFQDDIAFRLVTIEGIAPIYEPKEKARESVESRANL